MDELFKGRHFDREIIALCVRWYLRYKLSFRDLVEMMGECGLCLAHSAGSSAMCQNSRSVGTASLAWRDDPGVSMKPTSKSEVAGPISIVRSTKKERPSISCFAPKRDVAAKAFFRKAFRVQGGLPHKITLDGYQASHRAAKEALGEHLKANQCKIRSSKYLTDVFDKAFPNPHGG